MARCQEQLWRKTKPEFLRGALDLLILKVVALGPIHGYAISQRIRQISQDYFQF
jgi:PadR family transcriptional regulator, regulatory protein PadR